MKPVKKKSLALLVGLLLVLQFVWPSFASDSRATSNDESLNTDIVRTGELSYRETPTGNFKVIPNPPTTSLDSSKINALRAVYSFSLKDNIVNDWDPANRSVSSGDYYLIDLPKEVIVSSFTGGTIADESLGDELATYAFQQSADGGHWQVKITFSSPVDNVNRYNIQGELQFDFTLDLSGAEAGVPLEIKLPIDSSKFVVLKVTKPVLPPTIPTKLEKKAGNYDDATHVQTWNIKLSPNTGEFGGCVFEDTIDPAYGTLKSITYGGNTLTSGYNYDPATGKLSYTIPAGSNGSDYTNLTLNVELLPSYLASSGTQSTLTHTNTATLTDPSREVDLTGQGTASVTPNWINKKGSLLEGNQIQWSIDVNTSRMTLYDAVVTDNLQNDVTLDTTSLKVDENSVTIQGSTDPAPADSVIYAVLDGKKLEIHFPRTAANQSNAKHTITLVTDVTPAPDDSNKNPTYNNTASLSCKYIGDNGSGENFSANLGMVGVGVPLVSVTKKPQTLTAANIASGTIDWDITTISNLSNYGKSTVVDTIPANQTFAGITLNGTALGTTDTGSGAFYTLGTDGDKQTVTITFHDSKALATRQKLVLTTQIKLENYAYNIPSGDSAADKEKNTFSNSVKATLYQSDTTSAVLATSTANASQKVSNTVIEKQSPVYEAPAEGALKMPRVNYTILINKNKMPLSNLVFTDDLSKMVTEFKKDVAGASFAPVNGVQWKLMDGNTSSVKIEKQNGSSWESTSLTPAYDTGTNVLSVDFGSTTSDYYRITMTLELDLTQNAIFKENGAIRCNNTALVSSPSLKDGSVPATCQSPEISNTLLGKSASQSAEDIKAQQMVWTIRLNQHRQTLSNPKVVDPLPAGLTLDPTSLKLYTNVLDKSGNFKGDDKLGTCTEVPVNYTYVEDPKNPGQFLLTVELPDVNADYILRFATDIGKSLLGKSIANTAYFLGDSDGGLNNSTGDLTVNSKPGGSSTTKAPVKVQSRSSDTAADLSGAQYSLFWLKGGTEEVFVRSITAADNTPVTFYGLTLNESYKVKQTKTPDGHTLDRELPVFTASTSTPVQIFDNTPQKTGSWTPAAKKNLNTKLTQAFSFELTADGVAVMNGTSPANNAVQADVAFTMADGIQAAGLLNFSNSHTFAAGETEFLVGNKTFTLTEEKGTLTEYTYDDTVHTLRIEVVNVKGQENLRVRIYNAANELISNDKGELLPGAIPSFTNIYLADGAVTLTAEQVVNGRSFQKDDFSYELYKSSTTPENLLQTVNNGNVVPSGTGTWKSSASFAPLAYSFTDVGVHTYLIVQKTPKPGYSPDISKYTIKVTVTDNGDGSLTSQVTSITKDDSTLQSPDVVFTSDYKASGALTPTGTVDLTGRTMADKQFGFTMEQTAEDGTVLSTISDAIAHSEGGSLALPTLSYTEADIGKSFYYRLTQHNDTRPGYTLDTAVYTLVVQVQDQGDGTLILPVVIRRDGVPGDIAYHNRYQAAGTLNLTGTQTLIGKDLPEGIYRYELIPVDPQGDPLPGVEPIVVANQANGSIPLTLPYTEADAGKTFPYKLRQIPEDKGGYSYDDTVYTVQVLVRDNGNGTLTPESTILDPAGAAELLFAGNYTTAELSHSLELLTTLDGRALQADQFTFILIPTDADGAPIGEAQTLKNRGDGSGLFAPVTYSQADIGKTFYYTAQQVDDPRPGYTYAKARFRFAVLVIDQLDGTLGTQTSITMEDGQSVEAAQFDNLYRTTNVSTALGGGMKLSGLPLKAGQFRFVLVREDGTVLQTVTNNPDGTFSFDNLTFTQADIGIHRYFIRALDSSLAGITDGVVEYPVTIEVIDNGDGTLSTKMTLSGENGGQAAEEPIFRFEPTPSGAVNTGDLFDSTLFWGVGILSLLGLAACLLSRNKHTTSSR